MSNPAAFFISVGLTPQELSFLDEAVSYIKENFQSGNFTAEEVVAQSALAKLGQAFAVSPVGFTAQEFGFLEEAVSFIKQNFQSGLFTAEEAVAQSTLTQLSTALQLQVSVTGLPATLSLVKSTTHQFTVSVSQTATGNAGVVFSVNGVVGGNSTVGIISGTGLYTAPSSVPSPAAVTVAATSVEDSSISDSSTVTITAS